MTSTNTPNKVLDYKVYHYSVLMAKFQKKMVSKYGLKNKVFNESGCLWQTKRNSIKNL